MLWLVCSCSAYMNPTCVKLSVVTYVFPILSLFCPTSIHQCFHWGRKADCSSGLFLNTPLHSHRRAVPKPVCHETRDGRERWWLVYINTLTGCSFWRRLWTYMEFSAWMMMIVSLLLTPIYFPSSPSSSLPLSPSFLSSFFSPPLPSILL